MFQRNFPRDVVGRSLVHAICLRAIRLPELSEFVTFRLTVIRRKLLYRGRECAREAKCAKCNRRGTMTEHYGDWDLEPGPGGRADIVGHQREMVSAQFERSQSALSYVMHAVDVNRIDCRWKESPCESCVYDEWHCDFARFLAKRI